MLDDAVFAGRVHALEDEQNRPLVADVQLLLQRHQAFEQPLKLSLGDLLAPDWRGISGIEPAQINTLIGPDAKPADIETHRCCVVGNVPVRGTPIGPTGM